MRLELRMKYCETVYRRYREASKESKARILDELCEVCGYQPQVCDLEAESIAG